MDRIDITDYLSTGKDKTPICREERQYALFLYNEIVSGNRDILEIVFANYASDTMVKQNINDMTIKDVFYEFAYMRDSFALLDEKKEREDFNRHLLNFCAEELKDDFVGLDPTSAASDAFCALEENKISHWNLGHIKSYSSYEGNLAKIIYYARCMMNAKPDIGILYSYKGKMYMCFVECKLESSETKYKFGFSQTDIQKSILKYVANGSVTEYGVLLLNLKKEFMNETLAEYLLEKHKEGLHAHA